MKEELKNETLFEGGSTTVSITLEDDTVIDCVVLSIFDVDGKDYIAVMPEEGNEDEGIVYLYRYNELENGEPELTNIETDEEYEIVSDAFDEILDEQEYLDWEFEDEE